MTDKEMTAEILREAKAYVPLFSTALIIAAKEHDGKKLIELAAAAQRFYKDLSTFMDLCDPTDLSPELVVLADYFRENSEEIEKALHRPPEDDSNEAWKH